MASGLFHLLFLLASFAFPSMLAHNTSSCPLDYTILNNFPLFGEETMSSTSATVAYNCINVLQGFRLALSHYTQATGYFFLPSIHLDACWDSLDEYLASDLGIPIPNVRTQCNITTTINDGACDGIKSVEDLTANLPQTALWEIANRCNDSLMGASACSSCFESVTTIATAYLNQSSDSVMSCSDLVTIYAGGVVNELGPSDPGVAWCLFAIPVATNQSSNHTSKYILYGSIGGALVTFILSVAIVFSLYIRSNRRRLAKRKIYIEENNTTNLTWFTMEEMKAATRNFAKSNMIGAGGYGNVFKGKLPDGSEIAVKRLKNSSPTGDTEFLHEVEVISSVRHVNLVPLRGCCVHSRTTLEGHCHDIQRIIVYDYMPNGSLYDRLFMDKTAKMGWPVRRNIAIGMAKGLAYLHEEVQPAIIHRDIKTSNILLDDKWNARVADLGLARFTPDGVTHVTTRVTGTHGYLAPEYALYGQLTEKSDVYSFGVVLLELLCGRKALVISPSPSPSCCCSSSTSIDSEQPLLLAEWAWGFVKRGRLVDILDPSIQDSGHIEEINRFVLVALLCAHSQVVLRPSITEALKMLENCLPLPSIPDRLIPLTSGIPQIKTSRSISSGSSSQPGFHSCHQGSATI